MIITTYKSGDALIDVSTSQEKILGGNTFSAPYLLARILEGGKEPEVLSQSICRGAWPCAPTLQSAIESLTPEQSKILVEQAGDHLPEFLALSEQSSPKIFYTELYELGRELENSDHLEIAKSVYDAIVGAGSTHPSWHSNQEAILPPAVASGQVNPAPTEIQQKAQVRLEVIQGGGSVGSQLDFSGRRMVGRILEPSGFVGMGLGLGVSRFTEAVVFSRFTAIANSGAPTFIPKILTSGLGKRLTARLAAFMTEVPSFTLGGKVTRSILGKTEDYSYQALKSELTSSALFLGGMKTFGISGGMLTRGITSPFQAAALRQASTLLGIMTGHLLEMKAGYKDYHGASAFLVDSLTILLDLHVMGEVTDGFYGARFKAFQQRMAESVYENKGDGGGFFQDLKAMWDNLGSGQFATINGDPIPQLHTPNSGLRTSSKESLFDMQNVFTQAENENSSSPPQSAPASQFLESRFLQGHVLIESTQPKDVDSFIFWRFMKIWEDGIVTLLFNCTSSRSNKMTGPLADLLRADKELIADLVYHAEMSSSKILAKIESGTGLLQHVVVLDEADRPKIILFPREGAREVIRLNLNQDLPDFPAVHGTHYRFIRITQKSFKTPLPKITFDERTLGDALTGSRSNTLGIQFLIENLEQLTLELTKSPHLSWKIRGHEGNILLTFAPHEIKTAISKLPKDPKSQAPKPPQTPKPPRESKKLIKAKQKLKEAADTFNQLVPSSSPLFPKNILDLSPESQLQFILNASQFLVEKRPVVRASTFEVFKEVIPHLDGPILIALRNHLKTQYPKKSRPEECLFIVEQVQRYIRDELKGEPVII